MWSLRRWWRQRQLSRHPIPEALWHGALARLPLLAALQPSQQLRLRELATLLLLRKRINGPEGFDPDPAMRVTVAALAALPILGLDLDWYDNWHEIVLHPDTFVQEHEWQDEIGVAHHERRALEGEAWEQGPVLLTWPEVTQSGQHSGFNIVIHELAHKLDMLNGEANGFPPLHRGMDPAAWSGAFGAAYADLCRRVDHGEHTALDPYATENPAEFFAVMCEAFFESPALLQHAYPAVYEQLRRFFRQDPLATR